MAGFSPCNLRVMKQFAESWPDFSIWQQVVSKLPWRSNYMPGYQNPIGVAEWQNQLSDIMGEELKSSLPSIEEIEKILE